MSVYFHTEHNRQLFIGYTPMFTTFIQGIAFYEHLKPEMNPSHQLFD